MSKMNRTSMFLGTTMALIDAKRRFCIPQAFSLVAKDLVDEGQDLFMVPDIEPGALFVKPLKAVFNDAAIDKVGPFVTPIPSLGKDRRFVVPSMMMDLCGFKPKETYVVSGHGEYFAIRNNESWKKFIALRK